MKTAIVNAENSSIVSSVDSTESSRTSRLVRRAQRGDSAALNRVCDLYYERLRHIVRKHLGKKLRQTVDSGDILQETFRLAVDRFGSFQMRNRASLLNWLTKIAENKIREAASFRSAIKRNMIKHQVGAELELMRKESGPLSTMTQQEELRCLRECMKKLPYQYRQSIILRDFARYSFKQVASETRRPSADAARMIHRAALLTLQKLMQHSTDSWGSRDSGEQRV